MRAKPDQKIKCVDMSGTANPLYYPNLPVVGEAYTIREVASNHNENSFNNSNASVESLPPPIPSQQTAQPPDIAGTNNTQSGVITKPNPVIFTRNSNGHDWQRADFQTRQQFCQTIATAESKEFNHDFTTDFYYSALDSFYNSSDPNILGENIQTIIGLTTSAALQGQ